MALVPQSDAAQAPVARGDVAVAVDVEPSCDGGALGCLELVEQRLTLGIKPDGVCVDGRNELTFLIACWPPKLLVRRRRRGPQGFDPTRTYRLP